MDDRGSTYYRIEGFYRKLESRDREWLTWLDKIQESNLDQAMKSAIKRISGPENRSGYTKVRVVKVVEAVDLESEYPAP